MECGWADKLHAENPRLRRGKQTQPPAWTEPKTEPAAPEPQVQPQDDGQAVIDKHLSFDDYVASVREQIHGKHVARPVTARERFSGTTEYTRADGLKVQIPQRDSSDIVTRHTGKTWGANSWKVQNDRGLFSDATPEEMGAIHKQLPQE